MRDDPKLQMARRIAAHALCGPEKWKPGVKAGMYQDIMNGLADNEAIVLGPLAAIEECTEAHPYFATSDIDDITMRLAVSESQKAAMQSRIAELEAENDRLSRAVGSGILRDLLNDEEQDEFVKFIKFLRSSPEAQAVVSNIGGSNEPL